MKAGELAMAEAHAAHVVEARPLPARLALTNARDRAAQVLTRMVEGHEPADEARVAACRAVLELGTTRPRP